MMGKTEIYELIKDSGKGMTQDELNAFTGLQRSTLKLYLVELRKEGKIEKVPSDNTKVRGSYFYKVIEKPYVQLQRDLKELKMRYERDLADKWKMLGDLVKTVNNLEEEIRDLKKAIKGPWRKK